MDYHMDDETGHIRVRNLRKVRPHCLILHDGAALNQTGQIFRE
jgi:hypothetical protein